MSDIHRWDEETLAPTDVKRQHYVPRLHLEEFTGLDGLIGGSDLRIGKRYRTSTLNAAVESHYNDVEIDEVVLSTEDWLGAIESDTAGLLKKLGSDPSLITTLTDTEELALARFLASLRFRGPAFRTGAIEMYDHLALQVKQVVTGRVRATLPTEEAEPLLSEWEKRPSEWWLRKDSPIRGSVHKGV